MILRVFFSFLGCCCLPSRALSAQAAERCPLLRNTWQSHLGQRFSGNALQALFLFFPFFNICRLFRSDRHKSRALSLLRFLKLGKFVLHCKDACQYQGRDSTAFDELWCYCVAGTDQPDASAGDNNHDSSHDDDVPSDSGDDSSSDSEEGEGDLAFPAPYADALHLLLKQSSPASPVAVRSLPLSSNEEKLGVVMTLWEDGYVCTSIRSDQAAGQTKQSKQSKRQKR